MNKKEFKKFELDTFKMFNDVSENVIKEPKKISKKKTDEYEKKLIEIEKRNNKILATNFYFIMSKYNITPEGMFSIAKSTEMALEQAKTTKETQAWCVSTRGAVKLYGYSGRKISTIEFIAMCELFEDRFDYTERFDDLRAE
jgi:hypothetical protein